MVPKCCPNCWYFEGCEDKNGCCSNCDYFEAGECTFREEGEEWSGN